MHFPVPTRYFHMEADRWQVPYASCTRPRPNPQSGPFLCLSLLIDVSDTQARIRVVVSQTRGILKDRACPHLGNF